KPGRDPRERFEPFRFKEGVSALEDLRPGMTLPGIVTNVTAFGAFVDIGVHQDGLVHISQLADRFVKDANEVVKVQQHVQVTVLEVDLARRRIALSMRTNAARKTMEGEGEGEGDGDGATTSSSQASATFLRLATEGREIHACAAECVSR